MKCCNCKKKNLKKILNFGKQPVSSEYSKKKNEKFKSYPLDLFQCNSCKLVQFSKLAPLNEMYGQNYGYRTSLSKLMIDHMKLSYLFTITIRYMIFLIDKLSIDLFNDTTRNFRDCR